MGNGRIGRAGFSIAHSRSEGSTGCRWSMPRIASVLGLLVMSVTGIASAALAASAGPSGMGRIEAAPYVPDGAHAIGALAPSAVISGAVVLQPRDNAALVRFIGEVTDKSSPLFHQYLPAGAFASLFGPA